MVLSTVHFADYIKMLPSAWVFENFIKETDSSRKILSSSMIEERVAEFTQPNTLRQQFLNLDNNNQLRCTLIYLLGENGLETASFKGLDDPLLLSFLVYAAINQSGDVRLLGFEEFKPVLLELCANTIYENIPVKESAETVSMWQWRCVNDIAMLSSIAAQKQLKKKKNGGLTRAASLQIKKLTDMGAPLKNENNDYTTNLMLDYCIHRQLIFETETEYLLNSMEFEFWLSLPVEQRLDDIKKFTHSFSGNWWLELLDLLLEKNIWIPLSIFPESIRPRVLDMLKGLRFIGIIELRKKGNEISVCRVSIHDTSVNVQKVMVLPDFSAVIAQETESRIIYQFAQIGSFITFDRVYKGKVSKAVLSDALSRGIEGDLVLNWLDMWQSPANVKETVREWLREFNRLYVTRNSLLVSSEEKVTLQIEALTPLRALIEKIPAHSLYKIKRGNEEKVREILTELGFDYRMPGQDLDIEIPQANLSEQNTITQPKWVPLTETQSTETEPLAMRGTKYGGELKILDLNEIVHVIDYAVLTNQNLIIDYEGSPYIKEGIYTIKPLSFQKGIEPLLDAEMIRTHSRKQLYIKKIRKIGVQS